MTTNRPLRVFLCHSSNDKPAVRELYQKLRAESWIQPWLDEEELFPGMDWETEIEKAVEASDVVIVFLSNNSINKRGFVQKELRYALDIALEMPEETIFIIPLRLEECTPPRSLRDWQFADYFKGQSEKGVERLLVSLKLRADNLIEHKNLSTKSVLPEGWRDTEPSPEIRDRVSHSHTDFRIVNGEWSVYGVSLRGKNHETEAGFREDAFNLGIGAGWMLIAVADGASSSNLSRVGANLAAKTAVSVMEKVVNEELPSQSIAMLAMQRALRAVWKELYEESQIRKVDFQALSTTLLLLMYHPKKELIGFAHIGDGLIAMQLEDERMVFLGSSISNEYIGGAYFPTPYVPNELFSKCVTSIVESPVRYLFVMTEGLSKDIYPPQERLPSLIKTIPSVMSEPDPSKALLNLLRYNLPGSFEDRTLIVACKSH